VHEKYFGHQKKEKPPKLKEIKERTGIIDALYLYALWSEYYFFTRYMCDCFPQNTRSKKISTFFRPKILENFVFGAFEAHLTLSVTN